jgi:hypothetical protein
MLFDYDKALSAIDSFRCVVAVLCGHYHRGGYFCDEKGVHHLTFSSPLNEGTDGAAFGLIAFANDRLEIHGPELTSLLPHADAEVPTKTPLPPAAQSDVPGIGAAGKPCQVMSFPLRSTE